MTDVELIDRLSDLGEQLDDGLVRVGDDLADAVVAMIGGERDEPSEERLFARHAGLISLAAAAVLLVAVLVAIPGPRRTIARWFGVGSVRIEPVVSMPEAPPTATDGDPDPLGLGPSVGADEAVAATGLPLPAAPSLGDPESYHLPGGPQIVARYDVSDRTVLVAILAGTTDEPLFVKEVGAAQVSSVEVSDADGQRAPGLWIEGEPHTFGYLDADGEPRRESFRLAGDTLLWERDGTTLRVEGARDLAEALEIASSMEP